MHIIPPQPRLATFISNLEQANLNQVLNHDIFSIISGGEVLLRIRSAVSPMVDAL
jgi:hypothetical protein